MTPNALIDTPASPAAAAAVRAAASRVAPLWPLDHFVAVNPYLGLADHTFDAASQRLARTTGVATTLAPGFYLNAIAKGRITRADVAAAMGQVDGVGATDVDDLLQRVVADDGPLCAEVRTVAEVATDVTGRDWAHVAIERITSWAAVHFDRGQAAWRGAVPGEGAYESWLAEARVDRTPDVLGLRGFRAAVAAMPEDHTSAAAQALGLLGVPADGLDAYLDRLLHDVSGWAGHARWIGWEAGLRGRDDDTLEQLVAVLLCWEAGLLAVLGEGVATVWAETRADGARATTAPPSARVAHRLVLQHSLDRAEQRRLVDRLAPARDSAGLGPEASTGERPRAQAVFCIDVRSEVLRRHLEGTAEDVDTLGFAGFFGMPIEYAPLAHERGGAQVPALLVPSHTVRETLDGEGLTAAAEDHRRMQHHVRKAWKSFKMGAITCFSFVGPVGLAYLPKLFTDGFGRTRPVAHPSVEALPRGIRGRGRISLDAGSVGGRAVGIPAQDRVGLAESALRGMSLTDGFARLVVLAGHGASTVNNPYDTGLQCGACGGHDGAANARVAVALLEDPGVRAGLAERGIDLPDDTRFVAALHDTTTDRVRLLDADDVPASHAADLEALEADLSTAGSGARAERAPRLGVRGDADTGIEARARDWAQTRPEWGLAGCHSFVAAPRHRTRGVDLGGRTFLHEYDWHRDEGFGVLEGVLTAPVVVASWISLQYHASTVDPGNAGSGDKTLHNVVGRLGVVEGNGGDLRVGLPVQSVHDGQALQHEPVRLNVVVEAPTAAITDVLSAHPDVRALFDNGWMQLLAMGEDGAVARRYAGNLRWEDVAA